MLIPSPNPGHVDALISILPPQLAPLARRGVVQYFRKGAVIIREGETGGTLHVLLSGSVKAYSEDVDAREITYCIDRAGEFFGEMSIDGGPRSASVIALEDTLCAVITRTTVWEHVASDPAFARILIERIIARGRFATEAARALALESVYERLRRFLELQAGEPQGDSARIIATRLTHQEVANRIGASREMVSRLMRDLANGGYVATSDGLVVLLKRLPPRW